MTYTHLTTNELVMIEAYHKNKVSVSQIAKSLKRTRQTIYKVLHFFEQGNSAMDYYNAYKDNKKRCGRRQTQLDDETKDFIQGYLEQDWSMDVIKGTFPERIPCSMRTLYRLADRGLFSKEDFPWKGKRKPNGHMTVGKSFQNGKIFPISTILISFLQIQAVQDNEVSTNIQTDYCVDMACPNRWISTKLAKNFYLL